jgi:hypothetical protein
MHPDAGKTAHDHVTHTSTSEVLLLHRQLYKSIAELMHPRSSPAQFLYTPIRCRLQVSLFKPFLQRP